MLEYSIIESCDLEKFKFEVHRHIRMGWNPLGGVSTMVMQEQINRGEPETYSLPYFYQSMTRDDKK